MKVTRGEIEDRQIVLHIEADEELVERHLRRAHQKVARRVNIPGFRKGKAPRSVVERFVGREYLLDEALETLAPEVVNQAVESEGLEVSATPKVSIAERDPTVIIDATVPLQPEATLGDYTTIHFDDEAEKVDEAKVEESLQQLREAQADWKPVDRTVEPGDLVTVTAKGSADGSQFVNMESVDYLADADNPNPLPGFSAALVGVEPGGTKSFTLEAPEDFSKHEIAGKRAEFEVSVTNIRSKVLPELTDDLVKGLGEDLNTIADLRSRIRENLEARASQALRESLEEKVLEELVERTEFDVPPLLLEHEAEHILYDQQSTLRRYNIDFQQYMQRTGRTGEEMLAEARDTAEKRLKRTLVLDRLADAESIEPTGDEINEELEQFRAQRESAGESAGEVNEVNDEEARAAVVRVLKRRKSVDRAIELATAAPSGASKSAARKTGDRKNITRASKGDSAESKPAEVTPRKADKE